MTEERKAMMALLQVQHIFGGYTNKDILDDVSFTVQKGEVVALIGLNGAGKSTTIKHIIGLMQPRKGTITINGMTFQDDPQAYRTQFTYIPEMPALYEELTLEEHLRLTAMAYGVTDRAYEQRVPQLLKAFRLEKKLSSFPAFFSKGMKQKVMIMCAFLVDVPLYIIDEPFVGLDPLAIQALLQLIEERKKEGAGVLLSTHILATAERYCDSFIILHDGQVKASGSLPMLQEQLHMPHATLDDIYIELTKEETNDD
ncbi:exoprotein ABC transporter ATP-binding protein EcsA [Anoxybacillus flavithermus TNO-09.006]|uniref:ABC transporter ATP-binding protein EcsA n=3 Tax=Anoxybacillaceae TaxID=3120669 RepID=A0A178TC84_9BACL|nr:ABC transporter ATP-binding protein [Anoxybacillus flavithermus]ELK21182.1 exoprotein ABC transporter ATP-binding protein EcsA [Anoxybacillus flavithermus TNO-09.006]OAO79196.1 ABC transporter ATP-binding protein EcsA [Anoxybacillus flavithermus]